MKLFDNLKNIFSKVTFNLQAKSPEILLVTGIVGGVAAAVMACKATTKLTDILDESADRIEKAHEHEETDEQSEDKTTKQVCKIWAHTGLKLARLYAPSVVVGCASISCICGSHKILKGRNVALLTSVTGLATEFEDYRRHVIDRFGEELDKELRYDISAIETEEKVIDENGKEKTVKKMTNVIGEDCLNSGYIHFFQEGCRGWYEDPEITKSVLLGKQAEWNVTLQSRGHVYLNEILSDLGIRTTKFGQTRGWIYDKERPVGDNFIDFGCLDPTNARCCMNAENVWLLDFNCDGDILSLMETHNYI